MKKCSTWTWCGSSLGLLAVLLFSGCGTGDTSSVQGKVIFNGQPVAGGSITFLPIGDGKADPGKPAAGKVSPDGTFTLGTESTSDGAVPGRHKVMYSAPVVDLPPGQELQPGQSPPPSPYAGLVPKQQEVEVKPSGNTIEIELVPLSG